MPGTSRTSCRQVRTAGAVSEVIDYDPTGLPLFRRVGSVGTWYVGKMATVTATVSATCTGAVSCVPTTTPAVAVHLLLGGTRLATVKAPAPASSAAAFAEVLYYHRDYQGSVIGTSRRGAGLDGLSGAQYRYTPYGQLDKVTGVTAQTDSELGYTGGLRLGYVAGAVTTLAAPHAPGLVLLGARVYHPELKRWLVPDTVDPLRYTYTGGDPVNFIDPSGRMMIDGHSWNLTSAPRVAFDMWFSSPPGGLGDLGIINYPDLPASQTVAVKAAGNQAPVVTATPGGVQAMPPPPGEEGASPDGGSPAATAFGSSANLSLGRFAGQLALNAASSPEEAQAASGLLWPVPAPNGAITHGMHGGNTNCGVHGNAAHPGLDLAAPKGAVVVSVGSGVVVWSDATDSTGGMVVVRLNSGHLTVQMHMGSLIPEGAVVQAGTPLGKVNGSGFSIGYHSHFEVFPPGTPLQPAIGPPEYKPPRINPMMLFFPGGNHAP